MGNEVASSPYLASRQAWFWPAMALLLAVFNGLTAATTGGLSGYLGFLIAGAAWAIRRISGHHVPNVQGVPFPNPFPPGTEAAFGIGAVFVLSLLVLLLAAGVYIRTSRAGRRAPAGAVHLDFALRLAKLAYVAAVLSVAEALALWMCEALPPIEVKVNGSLVAALAFAAVIAAIAVMALFGPGGSGQKSEAQAGMRPPPTGEESNPPDDERGVS